MAIWIDPPLWPAHGKHFSHLISDTSYAELHDFASRAGLPARAFDGDHYDVPGDRHERMVTAGAAAVDTRELLRLLQVSGLRIRKRRGEKVLAAHRDIPHWDFSPFDVDVIASTLPPPDEARTGAAAVFVRDVSGCFGLVHTVGRAAWGAPGGGREPGESVEACAVREVREETGLAVAESDLRRCGFERITFPDGPSGRWAHRTNYVAIFSVSIGDAQPAMQPREVDVDEVRWVGWVEFERLCRREFWWPLAAYLFGPSSSDGRVSAGR